MEINTLELRKILSPWLQRPTWHTSNPTEVKNFNNAIHEIFQKYGIGNISVHTFAQAILDEVNERQHRDSLSAEQLDDRVHKSMLIFESISRYLADTRDQ